MLVLSRREQESIVFPKLGIRIQVTRVRGKAVSLGVDAPEDVRVLRGELQPDDDVHVKNHASSSTTSSLSTNDSQKLQKEDREREHELRNRVNTLTLALHLLQKRAKKADGAVDEMLLSGAIDELALIEEALQDNRKTPSLDEVENIASLPLALLVDDNANETSLLAGYLRQFGFRVATALDGRAALRFIDANSRLPDIVLLDMNMPGLDGRGTIVEIQKQSHCGCLRSAAKIKRQVRCQSVPAESTDGSRSQSAPTRLSTK
jgi:carbon storage regulator CsrA